MRCKYLKLYWFLKEFEWMKVYLSPFKPPIPRFYFGKIALGTPYFLPRVFRKAIPGKAKEVALKEIKEVEKYNEREQTYKRTVKSFDEIYAQKIGSSFPQPKKIGFDFVGLGYKTKWSNTDFRHEWNPIWSFVFFGYQLAVTFVPEEYTHFWESYLFYEKATDKNKSIRERLNQARCEFPNTWTSYSENGKVDINYWLVVIKNKYLNL
jgi:hypothetical protein